MKEEGVHGPRHAASVALQSDHRRILCSNEQSKLCSCPTKSLLSDKNQLARPSGAGESAPKSRILEEKKSTNQKSHVYGENNRNKDGQKAQK